MHQSDLMVLETSYTSSFQNSFITPPCENFMLIKNFVKIKINEASLKGDAAGTSPTASRNTNHS